MNKIIILNGPNLNLLGEREKSQYGNFTLKDVERKCNEYSNENDIKLSLFQSNIEGELVEQIQYSLDAELVSSDIVGSTAPSIFDSKATIANGDSIVIYVWYDNEYGYSHQVIRLAKYIAKVRRYTYY